MTGIRFAGFALGLSMLATSPASSVPRVIPELLEATNPCSRRMPCEERQVSPFGGGLGRPCGYRRRPTSSGTRKVRVCF